MMHWCVMCINYRRGTRHRSRRKPAVVCGSKYIIQALHARSVKYYIFAYMRTIGRVCNNIIITMSTGEKKSVRFTFLHHFYNIIIIIFLPSASAPQTGHDKSNGPWSEAENSPFGMNNHNRELGSYRRNSIL